MRMTVAYRGTTVCPPSRWPREAGPPGRPSHVESPEILRVRRPVSVLLRAFPGDVRSRGDPVGDVDRCVRGAWRSRPSPSPPRSSAIGGSRRVPLRDRIVLTTLRVALLLVVLACLFRPVLVVRAAVPQQNVVGVLLDDSRSMQIADMDGGPRSAFVQIRVRRARARHSQGAGRSLRGARVPLLVQLTRATRGPGT